MWGNQAELADARRRIAALEARLTQSDKNYGALVTRFDEFFDAVAHDLGYEAAETLITAGFNCWHATASPRQLAKTTPPPPEIVRKKTARCKK